MNDTELLDYVIEFGLTVQQVMPYKKKRLVWYVYGQYDILVDNGKSMRSALDKAISKCLKQRSKASPAP
jgi:hypothetical protein